MEIDRKPTFEEACAVLRAQYYRWLEAVVLPALTKVFGVLAKGFAMLADSESARNGRG